jgi:hypothetical protein
MSRLSAKGGCCQQPGQARTEIGLLLLIRPKSERAPSPDSRTYHCTGGALGGHVQLHVVFGAGGPSIHQSTPALGAELHPASASWLRRADGCSPARCRCADWQTTLPSKLTGGPSQNRTSLSTHVSELGRSPFSVFADQQQSRCWGSWIGFQFSSSPSPMALRVGDGREGVVSPGDVPKACACACACACS